MPVIKSTHYRDDGECNYLFTRAGEDAVKTCVCDPIYHLALVPMFCGGTSAETHFCFTAACDWMPYGPACEVMRSRMYRCRCRFCLSLFYRLSFFYTVLSFYIVGFKNKIDEKKL